MLNWAHIDSVLLDLDGTLLDLHYDNYFWNEFVPARYAQNRSLSVTDAKTKLSPRMLELQGMQPEGRLHSGIDDTRNIARIAMQMGRDGCRMYLNEALPMKRRASAVQGNAQFKPMDLSAFRS